MISSISSNQFNTSHLFALSLNVKQFYLTHRYDPISCYCCIQWRTTTLMYKNIICFFFSLLPEIYFWELEMAEMHTYGDDGAIFLWNLSAFLLRFTWVKILSWVRWFSGYLRNSRGYISHLSPVREHASYLAYQPRNPHGTSAEEHLRPVYLRK